MFRPELSLIAQPNGRFTLLVKVQVPNSCYVAGSITPGAPAGQVTIPEAAPYTFEIRHRHGACAQFVHDITEMVPDLQPSPGHQWLIVFATVDGQVVGHAAIAFPPLAALEAAQKAATDAPALPIIPDSVSATVSSDLIGQHTTLRVDCLVATPTPGFKATLKLLRTGINPRILLLELVIESPSGLVIQTPSTARAHYQEDDYRGHYTDVSIINQDQIVTVPVIVLLSFFDPAQPPAFSVIRSASSA